MQTEMPLQELQAYRPDRSEPDDFDAFWARTLDETRGYPLDARFDPFEAGLKLIEVFDVTFNGYGGQPIKGWLLLPKARETKLPCVVEYIGYGGGRGYPFDWLLWSTAGYAHLVMDTRGQGSIWRTGDTPDIPESGGATPQAPGFMTRGVLSPETYYYRRVFSDAVRAVEAARAHPAVDAGKIVVTGGSQGGGISLAVSALAPDITAAMPDVPFLCHFRRAPLVYDTDPYQEIVRYLKIHRDHVETVFKTLDYFDGMNFATRARAKALFSVGLLDDICPPSTVYAAYNYYAGPKEITIWEFNKHEGGETFQNREKVRFLQGLGLSAG